MTIKDFIILGIVLLPPIITTLVLIFRKDRPAPKPGERGFWPPV